MATYTYSTNNRIANLEPLSKALEQHLNRPIKVESYPDVPSFIQGIKSNQVDIGFINTLGYLLLSLDNENMEPIATLEVKENAKDNYKTVLLGNSKKVGNVDSLKSDSEKVAIEFVAPGSTSGNLIPRLFLSSIGIQFPEQQFEKVSYAGNHKAAIERLIQGKTDICAVGSNEYHRQLQIDSSLSQSTSILWMSEEIPLGPVLLNKRITDSEKKSLIGFLSTLHKTNPEALKAVKDGWSEAKQAEKFLPISDHYYDNFRKVNGNSSNLPEILNFFLDNLFR
ncbi:phosphate/phosphite/phosphonate ABC transporter substrate-binding protein [Flagellimonas meridianipacifica]|uniref:Phosphate/phosphite/phosphonate ABC transporter binding protein n=1 Tax=Flagellimonas meridianipacifica TaxID=1080225 RepID=A0A2T0MC97_9FLAO|nr:phosphate/phosphite/phosphonate ABC transporter substrate-binding protein [Allomuricauda pacifica]PRX55109.1 phosphate/phosphite/phosphonate ABC transporter binding protein [Allomuricauda pacifica]